MLKRLEVDIGDNKITLGLNMTEYYGDSFDIRVHITSEENAYGAVNQMWFDGEVSELPIKRDMSYFVPLDSVHEYHHLSTTCAQRSFYECVAQEMLALHDCPGKLCEAVSLPKIALPPCKEGVKAMLLPDSDLNCSLVAFWKAYDLCFNEKPCTVVEYKLKDDWHKYEVSWAYGMNYANISYGFFTESSQDSKVRPHKTIHTEFLVWNEITFVAYICGTLGLTIGISLLDVYIWMVDKVGKVWRRS